MRLVISTASRFKNYGLPQGDLVQEGVVGLMQAAARFEPERDVRFSTYAAWWIRSAMQDYILRNWSVVRTGTTAAQKALFFNLRRLRAKINDGSYGQLDEAGKKYIAEELDVEVVEVEAMEMRLMGGDQSLNATISPSGEDAWQDFLADDRPNPEDIVGDSHDTRTRSEWLASSLAELSRARAHHHPRAPPPGGRPHARGARRPPRHQQGARPPDRAPRPPEAEDVPDAPHQGPGRGHAAHRHDRGLTRRPPPATPVPAPAATTADSPPPILDVAIVGGGHAGLLLGAALAGAGFTLRLLERASPASVESPPATAAPWPSSPAASRSPSAWASGAT
jgi:RNA polymerase sigma factor (sigma-70 family)